MNATPERTIHSAAGGELLQGSSTEITSVAPWTLTPIASAAPADESDINAAIRLAGEEMKAWGDMSWTARGAALARIAREVRSRAEELAELMAAEVGKPITEARVEAERTAGIFEYYAHEGRSPKGSLIPADEPGVAIATRRRPLGTVVAITPWNFPLAIPAWKIAPALLCGNSVVFKPATAAMACGDALFQCISRGTAPNHPASLVLGGGDVASMLLGHPDIRAVSFTGSTAVGQRVRETVAPRGVRTQLEMGGKNAAVILDDADVDSATDAIARAAYGFAGQKCTATSLVLAERSVYEAARDRLAELTISAPWGDPQDEAVWGGPLISEDKTAQVRAEIDEACANEDSIIASRSVSPRPALLPPTLMNLDTGSRLVRTELFAPVLGVLPPGSEDDLVERANAGDYGLVASIFSRNIDRIRRLCNRLEVGVVAVNRPSTGLEVQAPFGGWKASGSPDAEQGQEALRFFTRNQTIYLKSSSPGATFP